MLVRPYVCVMFTNQLHTWPKLRVVDKGGVYSEVVTAHILKNKITPPLRWTSGTKQSVKFSSRSSMSSYVEFKARLWRDVT